MEIYLYLKDTLQLDEKILTEAFLHPSYSDQSSIPNYERLEFVGDAVIDLVVAKWLYQNINEKEGILTKLRSIVVRTDSLAEVGKKLNVAKYIITAQDYQILDSDIEDCVEAMCGAIYISKGAEEAEKFVIMIFEEKLESIKNQSRTKEGLEKLLEQSVCEQNPINELQEYCQKNKIDMPKFILIEKRGEEHRPEFEIECQVNLGNVIICERAVGEKKKIARKKAAEKVLKKILIRSSE
ncbi:MAG: ribonuclease III family protein [Candidatus Heimdallarchaeaceae archaeon]